MTFLVGRLCDTPAVADAGTDLGRLVEQGERAFGLLVREPVREVREAEGERVVDAGGTGDARRFVTGRDRGVERRFGELERTCEHDECVCEFVGVPGRSRELDPFPSVTSDLLEATTKEREDRL